MNDNRLCAGHIPADGQRVSAVGRLHRERAVQLDGDTYGVRTAVDGDGGGGKAVVERQGACRAGQRVIYAKCITEDQTADSFVPIEVDVAASERPRRKGELTLGDDRTVIFK